MKGKIAASWILAIHAALVLACASLRVPEGWQHRHRAELPPPESSNLPLDPARLEAVLSRIDFEVRDVEPAGSGVMGALRVEAYYPSIGREIAFKWKIASSDAESWNNTPRREIAAYQVQKLFLDPGDYVVPTTVANCIPLEVHADIDSESEPNLDGSNCVFGTQSVWLEDVTDSEPLFERSRFYREPYYAWHLAHYNLLTHLTENRDTRPSNRLASKDPHNRRVYAVDNGITFGEWLFNWFRPQWDEIRVPALPLRAIEKLRTVDDADLASFEVVAQFELDEEGIFRPVEAGTPFEVEDGARRRGRVLQLGLTPDEIEELGERIAELLESVDDGEIPLF